MSTEADVDLGAYFSSLHTPWARVTPASRFAWYIQIVDGPMEAGFSVAWGRKRADRKAARMLRRYVIKTGRRDQGVHKVTL